MTIAACLTSDRIVARQQTLIDEFLLFDDWSERYQYLIELGQLLPPMPMCMRTDRDRLPGCSAETFLAGERRAGRLHLFAASDMPVIAGLLALVVRVYSGLSPGEILRQPPLHLDRIDLTQRLSPHRRIALLRIHERLVQLASDQEPVPRRIS